MKFRKTASGIVVAAAVAVVPVALPLARAIDRAPPPLAIRDARIVVAPGRVLERATIVFRDGRIEAVGPAVAPPSDAVVEDGRGLWVYPGWIDAGASFPIEPTTPEAQKAREGVPPNLQEEPPIATPEARRKGIRPSLDLAASALVDGEPRLKERRAGFALALATPPVGFLSGQSALVALGERPRRDSVVATRVLLHGGFRGPEERGYPHTLMGAHAHLRQLVADARRHRELVARAARGASGPRPPFDPDLDATLAAVDGAIRVAFAADDEQDVARALRLANELGWHLVLTDARHAAKAAPLLRREGIPALVSLAWGPKLKPPAPDFEGLPPERKGRSGKPLEGPFFLRMLGQFLFPYVLPASLPAPRVGPEPGPRIDPSQEPRAAFRDRERRRREEIANLKDLYLAGVKVAITTAGLKDPHEVRERLREAIKAGLPEEAAIAALTRDAAEILGVGDRLGTLVPGKLAFATVLTGPLTDEKAKIRFVVVDGERLDGEKTEDDVRLARIVGRWKWDATLARGTLVLESAHGKLTGRIQTESSAETLLPDVTLEGEKLRFALPRALVPGEKQPVRVDARWVAESRIEGTAVFAEGPRAFRAEREPK